MTVKITIRFCEKERKKKTYHESFSSNIRFNFVCDYDIVSMDQNLDVCVVISSAFNNISTVDNMLLTNMKANTLNKKINRNDLA